MVELTPGLVLGARFVLMRRLGRGGTAEVWLANDRERGKPVALKILDDEKDALKGTQPFAARAIGLAAEIARARLLPSEFTVPIHRLLEVDGRTLIVMEYMPGGDIGQFRGRSFESWARHADEIAASLEALHAQGLVHRDLKCSNVLLDAEGRARLSDFAMAAETGARVQPGGSPYNASPQQLRGEAALPADDLYAFGALLYELIAGQPPYYPEITRDRVLHEPVPPLVPRGIVPVGVRELALRLLAKSPGERPASAADVRARLAAATAGDGGIMEPLAHALPDPARPAARGSRLIPISIAAAAIVAIAAVIWLPQRFAAEHTGIAEDARAQAEQQSQARLKREQSESERFAARADAEAARTKFETAFKALDERAAARWATAVFAEARNAGAMAADRYATEKFAEAASGWKSGSEKLATLEAGAAKVAEGNLAARPGCSRRGPDRRRARRFPARARDRRGQWRGEGGHRARRQARPGIRRRRCGGRRRKCRAACGRRGGLPEGALARSVSEERAGGACQARFAPRGRSLCERDVARIRRTGERSE